MPYRNNLYIKKSLEYPETCIPLLVTECHQSGDNQRPARMMPQAIRTHCVNILAIPKARVLSCARHSLPSPRVARSYLI